MHRYRSSSSYRLTVCSGKSIRRRIHRTTALIPTALIALALAACGSEQAPAAPSKDASAPQPEQGEPVELVFYSFSKDSEQTFNERFGNALRKRFPDYSIKYIQRVPGSTDPEQLITSGQRIDIVWDSIPSFAGSIENGLAYDMTELIAKHDIDLSRFQPSLIEAVRKKSNGGLYALPLYDDRMALYYNKDIFDRFGVPYPQDGMTWDEIIELGGKLNHEVDGTIYTGFAGSINHLFLSNSYSLPLVDSQTVKATINREEWRNVIDTTILRPAKHPVYQKKIEQLGGKLPGQEQFVKEKTLAMFAASPTLSVVFSEELSSFSWDIVSFPSFKELPGVGAQSYPGLIYITKQSQHKDAAMEALKYLISDEYQREASGKGTMTVLNDENIHQTLGQDGPFKDKRFAAFFAGSFPPIAEKTVWEGKVNVLAAYKANIVNAALGRMDVNTLLRTAEEEVNRQLASLQN